MKALMVTVIPVILSQTVYQIGFTLDDLMFGNLMAAKGVDNTTISSLQGVFNSQYNILINAPVAVATAMASSTIPSIAASTVSGNQKEIHRKVRGVVKFNMAVAIPAAVGLAVLARPILTLLFPSLTTYRDLAANLLVYGSSAVVFFALSTITSAVLQSVNQMRTPVIHGALSMVLHVMLLYLLLRFTDLGIYGLIIGNVTFLMVICALNWRSVGAALSYRQEVGKTFLIPLIASLVIACYPRHLLYPFLPDRSQYAQYCRRHPDRRIILRVLFAAVSLFFPSGTVRSPLWQSDRPLGWAAASAALTISKNVSHQKGTGYAVSFWWDFQQ